MVFDMCSGENGTLMADQIYKRYTMLVDEVLRREVKPVVTTTTLPAAILLAWQQHHQWCARAGKIFAYVDRTYVRQRGLTLLRDVGATSFYLLVFVEVKDVVLDYLRAGIERRERGGEMVEVVKMLRVLMGDEALSMWLGQSDEEMRVYLESVGFPTASQ